MFFEVKQFRNSGGTSVATVARRQRIDVHDNDDDDDNNNNDNA